MEKFVLLLERVPKDNGKRHNLIRVYGPYENDEEVKKAWPKNHPSKEWESLVFEAELI